MAEMHVRGVLVWRSMKVDALVKMELGAELRSTTLTMLRGERTMTCVEAQTDKTVMEEAAK